MAYITKRKPSPVGDKPKEDKIEKPTNKWIQKKKKPTNKWIQKKSHEPFPTDVVDKRDLRPVKGVKQTEKGTPSKDAVKEIVSPFKEESKYIQKKMTRHGIQKRVKHNIGGRANLLEEMGRIDARRHPDAADRAEKRRVIGELNRGYNKGGLVIKGKPKLAKKGWK